MNFTQEMPSDITVLAGGASFSLHKFPLVSRCGYIRNLISESSDPSLSKIELLDIPGGKQAFELATKFCYGINFEITSENIAMLRCVSEYLQMTEEFAVKNLVGRCEAYLNEVALKNPKASISVLFSSQKFLQIAEEVKLVSRCIDAIAYLVCNDRKTDGGDSSSDVFMGKASVDWWAEDLTALRIDLFQRVLIALLARGFKHNELGPVLILYAEKSLQGMDKFVMGRKKMEPREEQEKRVIAETIASLLPKEKDALPVSFISFLLKSAIHLDTTISCRLDLEKRMAFQLGEAVLDDILIPSFSITGETLFDVETIKRVLMNFLENETVGKSLGTLIEECTGSTPLSEMGKVGKLMESYLAEIAADRNLSVSRFVGFAEIIPEQSRATEDGMYRAIDIYLKAHPAVNEGEKKKICRIMNCQKLSPEACAHAAQNERLSVQSVLQVLYCEQQRLRESINTGLTEAPSAPAHPPRPDTIVLTMNEFTKLKKENESLKIELVKMKMKMKKLAKDKSDLESNSDSSMSNSSVDIKKGLSRRKSFINVVTKKLGRLYPFPRAEEIEIIVSGNKKRRESVSEKPRRSRRNTVS